MRKCRHRRVIESWWMQPGYFVTPGDDVLGSFIGCEPDRLRCLECGAWLSLGEARDTPETAIEVRAAELAADFVRGVGIGGHRPDHCTGEHCWHWFEDDFSDDASPCCYCGHDGIVLPGIENECQVGALASVIASHGEQGGER